MWAFIAVLHWWGGAGDPPPAMLAIVSFPRAIGARPVFAPSITPSVRLGR